MNTTTTTSARAYSPAVYLAAFKHSAARAAARGAEARREEARNSAAVRVTIAAVLQSAEDAAARRAPTPSAEAIAEAIKPAAVKAPARARFDIAEVARRASADYADLIAIDAAARSLPLWYDCLRRAAAELRDESTTTSASDFWRASGDAQYATLRRAAARVPVWAARARRRLAPDAAAAILPSARWTLYSSGNRAAAPAADDDGREVVFTSSTPYDWMTREARRGDRDGALDAVAAEAWLRLRRRHDSGRDDADAAEARPYFLTIYRETMQAAAAIGRRDHDRPARQREVTRSLDEDELTAAARYPSPEAEVITRETIRAAARDGRDRAILRAVAYGWGQEETAAHLAEVIRRDAARAEGRAPSEAELAEARAITVNHSTVSRRLARMTEYLIREGVMDAPDAPGYHAAHNPVIITATEAATGAGAGWNWWKSTTPAAAIRHDAPAAPRAEVDHAAEARRAEAEADAAEARAREALRAADADAMRRAADARAARSLARLARARADTAK